MAMCLREIHNQWKLREELPANWIRRKMEDREAEREKAEHQMTRRLFSGLRKTYQARVEGPGLPRCFEASNPFCLVALGPLAFSNSVVLLVKEDANTLLHKICKAVFTEVCVGSVEEILKDVKQGEKKESLRHFALVTFKASTERKHSVELQYRCPLPTEP